MASGGSDVSTSALGAFYDALYDFTAKQAKKYGDAGIADLVPGQVTDALADGIVTTASALAGYNTATTIVEKNLVVKPLLGYYGAGTGLKYTVTQPTIKGEPVGTQLHKYNGEVWGYEPVGPGEIPITAGSISESLINPAGVANKAADSYWNALLLARQIDTISDFFGTPYSTIAGQMRADKSAGVDSDIVTAIGKAKEGQVRSNLKGYDRSDIGEYAGAQGKMFEDKGAPAALNTAVAMNAGIDSQAERDEFATYYDATLKKEILAEYNKRIAGTTYNTVGSFNDLFTDQNRGKKIWSMSTTDLFDPSLGGFAVGDVLQDAYRAVVTKHASDPTLSASLRTNLTNFYALVDDQSKMGNFLINMSKGIDLKKGDLRPIIKSGIEEIKDYHAGTSADRDVAYERAEESVDKDVDSWAKSGARGLSYMYFRWKAMPTLSKIFTPVGLLTGTSWLQMATWTGTPWGPMAGRTAVTDSLLIKPLETSRWQNQLDRFAEEKKKLLSSKATYTGSGAAVPAFLTARIKSNQDDIDAVKAKIKKQLDASKPTAGKPYAAAVKEGLGWKMVDILPGRANFIQKRMYMLYAVSPGAFFGGLLNGDTFQRLAWIGSDFGKSIKKKLEWSDIEGKYVEVLDTSGFKWFGKLAYNMLNSKSYQSVARVARGVGWALNFPAKMTQVMLTQMNIAVQKVANSVYTKLLNEQVRNWLAKIAKVATRVVGTLYTIFNTITFGALDKIVGQVLRITFQLVMGVVIGVIALSVMGLQIWGSKASPKYLASNLGTGGLLPPDSGYNPILVKEDPYGNPVDPGSVTLPPIDWSQYQQYSNNACPIQLAGGSSPVTYCSQGPASHYARECGSTVKVHCNPAIDLAPGDRATQIVAPDNGTVSAYAISCLSGGTVVGLNFKPDGKNDTYRFLHVIIKPGVDGQHVTKGTVIGAMIIGKSACSTGSHVHMEVWHGSTYDMHPEGTYITMCHLGSLNCAE